MTLATFDVDINTKTMFTDKKKVEMKLECEMHELMEMRLPSTIASTNLNWNPCIAVTIEEDMKERLERLNFW